MKFGIYDIVSTVIEDATFELAYFLDCLVHAHDLLQASDSLLKSLRNAVEVRHRLEELGLKSCKRIAVVDKYLNQVLSLLCDDSKFCLEAGFVYNSLISCRLTRGCLIHCPSNRAPCPVLVLLSKP